LQEAGIGASMELLRKLLAIALLAVFGMPFASSLLALTPKREANLPACCRRNGRHHCMQSTGHDARLTGDKPGFSAAAERCPFMASPAPAVPNHESAGVLPGRAIFAGLMRHPAVYAETPALWRIHGDRTHQKRGPPTA